MLKFYYTTTKGQDELQSKFDRSLGGYKSSSLVKNDEFDNFFGEISNYTISENNQNQYIGLILKNEGANKTNVLLSFGYPEGVFSKILIAAVELTDDADSVKFMENVPSIHSSPVYAEFFEADGLVNAVSLGDLNSDEMLGIWFKREILVDVAKSSCSDIIEEDPENEHLVKEKDKETSDTINIVISYD